MIEDLLYIAKVFLNYLHKSNFMDEERDEKKEGIPRVLRVLKKP